VILPGVAMSGRRRTHMRAMVIHLLVVGMRGRLMIVRARYGLAQAVYTVVAVLVRGTHHFCQLYDHGGMVAFRAISPSAIAIALIVGVAPGPTSCLFANQAGSLYVNQTLADASCQTKIFKGKSMPIV
jgi:hypothetical protein